MSHQSNTEYLEKMYEVFAEGLTNRDFDLCKDVMDQLYDRGFYEQSVELGKEMLTSKMKVNY